MLIFSSIAVACLAWHSSTVASRRRARGARSAAHPDLHACQPASTTLQSNENPYKLHVPSNMSSNFISHFYLSAAPMILLQIFSLCLSAIRFCNRVAEVSMLIIWIHMKYEFICYILKLMLQVWSQKKCLPDNWMKAYQFCLLLLLENSSKWQNLESKKKIIYPFDIFAYVYVSSCLHRLKMFL